MLVPRLTSGQREGISNTATGLLVFDTDTGSFWFYNGTAWVNLSTPDDDGDPTNELQALSYDPDNKILTLDNGGNVDLSGLDDASAAAAAQAAIDTHLADDQDLDPSNELQALSYDPATKVLTLANGGNVDLSGLCATTTTEDLLEVILPNSAILYVHPTDNSTGNIWGDFTDITELPNITSTSEANMDYNGERNTQAIVDQLQNYSSGNYAAKLCADLVAFGFDDWYLPAAGELNMMYKQLGPTDNGFNGSGDITSGSYWSSSEFVDDVAWTQFFDFGVLVYDDKDSLLRCRCVRR